MKDSPTTAGSSSDFSKKPLGEILIEAGLIPIHQLELALQEQKHTGMRVGEILVLHGWIKQETVDFFADKWTKFIEEKDKKPLIYYFQQAGLLNDEQVEAIARLQQLKHKKTRFHRLAVEQGYLKRTTVDFFLAYLFNIYSPKTISVAKPYEVLKRYSRGEKNFQKINLSKAPLMSVSLKEVVLNGSNLRKADLSKANLSNSSLIHTNLKLVNFTKAILTEVNFTQSYLTQAIFQEAHLEKANFQSAVLHEVDFKLAYLAQVNFAGADLTKAKLPLDYHYDVYYDRYTAFDPDFDPERAGWKKIK
ncbi:MAG: pentapeptide repeat-containing protein [Pleurocapsa sp. MO_226.B13]|nr:pentapeptide repeat-containing protein [Pleurocapsa sp. MO_226.B13]